MYHVHLSHVGHNGCADGCVCMVSRKDLREALFRVTDYLEAETVGRWFSLGSEPLRLQLSFVLEVIHVPH